MVKNIFSMATEFSRDFEVEPKRGALVGILEKTLEFIHEEVHETVTAVGQNNIPEIVDGFGDIAFIALNGIYKAFRLYGDTHEEASQKAEEVMRRICKANLGKKQPDGTILYKNGKVQKPTGWKPPVYEDMMA